MGKVVKKVALVSGIAALALTGIGLVAPTFFASLGLGLSLKSMATIGLALTGTKHCESGYGL